MINGKTIVYGIIGNPVGHSFSPAMHNAAFNTIGLNCVYVPFCVQPADIYKAIEGMKALGIGGANVTVPYKETVIPFLDRLTGDAVACGAVNTITNKNGFLTGHNTDGGGFTRDLVESLGYDPAQGPALVIGAGGSARAVISALAQNGCPAIAVVNRTMERAERLAGALHDATGIALRVFPWDSENRELVAFSREASLLVNCTPAGMLNSGVDFPLPPGVPGKGQLAYDLVYNPPRTPFIKRAENNGATVAGGLGMLLYQGALSFETWTGHPAPVEVMRRELLKQAELTFKVGNREV